MDRAAVFIDGGYLSKVLILAFNRPQLDYECFSDKICEGCERLRSYYYDCMPYQSNPPTETEKKRYAQKDSFIYNLKRLRRFEIRLGKLIYLPKANDYIQKRVDVLFSVDLVKMSATRQISKAVLVTGDSDFVPAIQVAKDAGVLTVIYHSTSSPVRALDELLYACDERREITQDIINSCLR